MDGWAARQASRQDDVEEGSSACEGIRGCADQVPPSKANQKACGGRGMAGQWRRGIAMKSMVVARVGGRRMVVSQRWAWTVVVAVAEKSRGRSKSSSNQP